MCERLLLAWHILSECNILAIITCFLAMAMKYHWTVSLFGLLVKYICYLVSLIRFKGGVLRLKP